MYVSLCSQWCIPYPWLTSWGSLLLSGLCRTEAGKVAAPGSVAWTGLDVYSVKNLITSALISHNTFLLSVLFIYQSCIYIGFLFLILISILWFWFWWVINRHDINWYYQFQVFIKYKGNSKKWGQNINL